MKNLTKAQLESMLTILNTETSMASLVEIYNGLSEKPVKKFTNKTTGLERTTKALEEAIAKFPEEKEVKTPVEKKEKISKTSTKYGKEAIAELKTILTEAIKDFTVRQWHLENPETKKAFQTGETKLDVENTYRDVLYVKDGRNTIATVVIDLSGDSFLDGKKVTSDDIIQAVEETKVQSEEAKD